MAPNVYISLRITRNWQNDMCIGLMAKPCLILRFIVKVLHGISGAKGAQVMKGNSTKLIYVFRVGAVRLLFLCGKLCSFSLGSGRKGRMNLGREDFLYIGCSFLCRTGRVRTSGYMRRGGNRFGEGEGNWLGSASSSC